MNNSKEIYIWCCDFNNYRGEGILARSFVEYLSKYKKKIIIKTFEKKYQFSNNKYKLLIKKNTSDKINLNFFEKYSYPIIGILWLWKKYFERKEIIYLNFNPLWNILVFMFSPPTTSFGPITGSLYYSEVKNISQFLRKYFFPILFKIGLFFLFIRKDKLLFSTSLLKKIIPKNKIKNCIFDFQINYYNKLNLERFKKKKDIDLIFYNRNHSTKKEKTIFNFIYEISQKHNVVVVGDYLNIKNVKNLNLISKKKINKIIAKSKYTFATPENIFSMFTLECLSLNTKIFYDKKQKDIHKYFLTKNLIPLNFNNYNKSLKIIKKIMKNNFKSQFARLNNKFWIKKIREFDDYFQHY